MLKTIINVLVIALFFPVLFLIGFASAPNGFFMPEFSHVVIITFSYFVALFVAIKIN